VTAKRKLTVLDLFSGIGGISLGLERTGGFRTVGFCEINKHCQQVLKRHWPEVPIFGDIHDITDFTLYQKGIRRPDVITAGFPCQPFSQAGKQQGASDERFLWPQLYRVIERVRPRYIILENVPRLLSIDNGLIFAGILYDFRQIGYDAEWQILSAASFGAWTLRKRLWIVAYAKSERLERRYYSASRHRNHRASKGRAKLARVRPTISNPHSKRLARGCERCRFWDETEEWSSSRIFPSVLPDLSTLAEQEEYVFKSPIQPDVDGVSKWVVNPLVSRRDRKAIEAIGNAVVPQIPQFIGECILANRDE